MAQEVLKLNRYYTYFLFLRRTLLKTSDDRLLYMKNEGFTQNLLFNNILYDFFSIVVKIIFLT